MIIVNLVATARRLTVHQATRRLGVKPETLYAYVSRGVLRSQRAADGRSSTFDADEVEALARRGRPRRSTRTGALDIAIATSLTSIERDRLRFRSHDAIDLAQHHTFEEVAHLLWTGELTRAAAPWPAVSAPRRRLPASANVFDRLTMALVSAAASDPARRSVDIVTTGRRAIAIELDALPLAGEPRVPQLRLPGREPVRHTIAGRLWSRLAPGRPPSGAIRALNAALVVLADHELAASTLAVRVAASTRADPYAALVAGIATVSGSHHGSASFFTRRTIDRAAATSSDAALTEVHARTGAYPGFGHSVYERSDPRAAVVLDLVRAAWPSSKRLAQVDALVAAAQRRAGLWPNIDLALAALGHAAGMNAHAGDAIFAIARTAGWLAHAAEEYTEPVLRFRPRADYVEP